jgi:MYXO-CTERM domain-containing protein
VGEGYSAQSCCGPAGKVSCLPPGAVASCDNICSNAVCLPVGLVPPDQASFLPDCPASDVGPTKCVPDFLFESFGNVVFKTCTSIAGAEGRCVPKCVTPVQDIIQYLPQGGCTPDEICAPCVDPRTGASTGACSTGCDTGPTEPPVVFQPCCPVAGRADAGLESGTDGGGMIDTGMCVPKAVVESVAKGASGLFSSAQCNTSGDVCVPRDLDLTRLGSFACLERSTPPDSGAGGTADAGSSRDASTTEGSGGTTGSATGGRGGTTAGRGGSTAGRGGTSSRPDAGVAGGPAHSKDDGCGCRMGAEEPTGRGTAALSLAGLAALFAGSRRRRRAR